MSCKVKVPCPHLPTDRSILLLAAFILIFAYLSLFAKKNERWGIATNAWRSLFACDNKITLFIEKQQIDYFCSKNCEYDENVLCILHFGKNLQPHFG